MSGVGSEPGLASKNDAGSIYVLGPPPARGQFPGLRRGMGRWVGVGGGVRRCPLDALNEHARFLKEAASVL